ncbi:nucleotide sugar dehydrogenase [Phocaeicola sp.]|uniref:nucleotide sugar dehydrogenase n=1 Tax=Phocaeicola sp. TaxID=2773926 RepID=UPI003A8C8A1B
MKDLKIGIIGLGYVGFPLACLFARKYHTVGYDRNPARVDELNACKDRTNEIDSAVIRECLETRLVCTSEEKKLKNCNVYIITVPTPVDIYMQPDLSPLKSASALVGKYLQEGNIVVYESTVYPGVTEDICVPILQDVSGLVINRHFYVGYSPERINPGDKEHIVENIRKITSGSTPEAAAMIDCLYASVLKNGTYLAKSIKVAEAAKVLENAQRDINIAFMNEVAKILNALGIDTNAVIDAAATKWNFLPFRPGLVGGHCIGVDPYYLIQKAQLHGVSPRLMAEARKINDSMGSYVAHQLINKLCCTTHCISTSRILLLGFSFKENCPDIRNTRVIDVYNTLKRFTSYITVYDPWANPEEVADVYGIQIINNLDGVEDASFEAILLAVAHRQYQKFEYERFLVPEGIVFDVKGQVETSCITYKL